VDRPFGQKFSTRSVVMGHSGAIATSHPLATQIGLEMLKRGGSAADAAIAANAALGLMEPTGCGVGGDLFAIVWDAEERRLAGLNASGRSPLGLSLEHLRGLGLARIPTQGPLSVTVPGAVDGWFELNGRFGRLPMQTLLEPAIAYAHSGFPVTEVIARYWHNDAERFRDVPGFAETYLPGGRAPRAGERFRNPRLADTYQLLAEQGRDAFYRGPVATKIEDYLRAQGGFLAAEDFAAHRSEWVAPVSTRYRDHDVWELPPNGQGIAVLQMLNIIEAYDLASMGWGSPEHLHVLIEAKKLAFEDRARFYADPSFAAVPVPELISKSYAASRRQSLDPARAGVSYPHGDPVLSAGDTVYLAAADAAGNMVSLIQSNFRGMGSGMTPGGLGFGLHNRGEAFSLESGHPNVYCPGKRPFHTIIPGFVTRGGEPVLAFGVMGADMQPQGQVQVLTNMIDFGMNLQQAGDAPRVRHDGSSDPCGASMQDGGVVFLESGFPESTRERLTQMGHRIERDQDGFGGYQAVRRDQALGVYMAASESRKDGFAAAY
jgi:gamma-glutamyltranspeptidase/glutathione hydrolase